MTRKILHISISVILLVATTGITVSKHYAGGKLFSVSITGEAKSCCEHDCDCCDNSVDTYRLTADYIISANTYPADEPVVDLRDINNVAEQDIYHEYLYYSSFLEQYKLPASVPDIQAYLQSYII